MRDARDCDDVLNMKYEVYCEEEQAGNTAETLQSPLPTRHFKGTSKVEINKCLQNSWLNMMLY